MDDLWRWQRRSWAEFCKVTLVMALLAQSNRVRLIAASPIFYRPEHRRGEWLMHDDPIAVVAHADRGWVAEILSGDSDDVPDRRSEENTSELQPIMRISYAVFCLKKKKTTSVIL